MKGHLADTAASKEVPIVPVCWQGGIERVFWPPSAAFGRDADVPRPPPSAAGFRHARARARGRQHGRRAKGSTHSGLAASFNAAVRTAVTKDRAAARPWRGWRLPAWRARRRLWEPPTGPHEVNTAAVTPQPHLWACAQREQQRGPERVLAPRSRQHSPQQPKARSNQGSGAAQRPVTSHGTRTERAPLCEGPGGVGATGQRRWGCPGLRAGWRVCKGD